MFERRLKLFLACLLLFASLLLARAAYVQLGEHAHWASKAVEGLSNEQVLETTRGRILDFTGAVAADELPCTDVYVDYRAIEDPPDADWVHAIALDRLHKQAGPAFRAARSAGRLQMAAAAEAGVRADIAAMWRALADCPEAGDTPEARQQAIDQIRQDIVQKVEMRRRQMWYRNYNAVTQPSAPDASQRDAAWQRWLTDVASAGATVSSGGGLSIDRFEQDVPEQTQSYAILRGVDEPTDVRFSGALENFPGLKPVRGTRRTYPFNDVGAQLLGSVRPVSANDLKSDPNRPAPDGTGGNTLLAYGADDEIGAAGVERLCEAGLRGTRGAIVTLRSDDSVVSSIQPKPGEDVRLSVDLRLQRDVQDLFAHAQIEDFAPPGSPEGTHGQMITSEFYGAAVVLDVATDQVRCLASYPTYDNNKLRESYATLSRDYINTPLLNRATEMAFEPGSTVKPLVGLSAITEGVLPVNKGIECTGDLYLDVPVAGGGTRRLLMPHGRCWVASKWGAKLKAAGLSYAHHPIPDYAPHVGHDGNPDGWLTYSDALERSCNVFFETVAWLLGPQHLHDWYKRWGLGRRTGIGIGENAGYVIDPDESDQTTKYLAGIGQAHVAATPLQMANVAATIARRGIWMRPRLIAPDARHPFDPPSAVPASVDLHLSQAGIDAAWDGMKRVVAAPAGTGRALLPEHSPLQGHIILAGKTGTAQAAIFTTVARDGAGQVIEDARTGRPQLKLYHPITATQPSPNPDVPGGLPWYRGSGNTGTDLAHAWFIGFAPADHPQIAFCVMVEYGGSGGVNAAHVATRTLELLVKHGYLSTDTPVDWNVTARTTVPAELLVAR